MTQHFFHKYHPYTSTHELLDDLLQDGIDASIIPSLFLSGDVQSIEYLITHLITTTYSSGPTPSKPPTPYYDCTVSNQLALNRRHTSVDDLYHFPLTMMLSTSPYFPFHTPFQPRMMDIFRLLRSDTYTTPQQWKAALQTSHYSTFITHFLTNYPPDLITYLPLESIQTSAIFSLTFCPSNAITQLNPGIINHNTNPPSHEYCTWLGYGIPQKTEELLANLYGISMSEIRDEIIPQVHSYFFHHSAKSSSISVISFYMNYFGIDTLLNSYDNQVRSNCDSFPMYSETNQFQLAPFTPHDEFNIAPEQYDFLRQIYVTNIYQLIFQKYVTQEQIEQLSDDLADLHNTIKNCNGHSYTSIDQLYVELDECQHKIMTYQNYIGFIMERIQSLINLYKFDFLLYNDIATLFYIANVYNDAEIIDFITQYYGITAQNLSTYPITRYLSHIPLVMSQVMSKITPLPQSNVDQSIFHPSHTFYTICKYSLPKALCALLKTSSTELSFLSSLIPQSPSSNTNLGSNMRGYHVISNAVQISLYYGYCRPKFLLKLSTVFPIAIKLSLSQRRSASFSPADVLTSFGHSRLLSADYLAFDAITEFGSLTHNVHPFFFALVSQLSYMVQSDIIQCFQFLLEFSQSFSPPLSQFEFSMKVFTCGLSYVWRNKHLTNGLPTEIATFIFSCCVQPQEQLYTPPVTSNQVLREITTIFADSPISFQHLFNAQRSYHLKLQQDVHTILTFYLSPHNATKIYESPDFIHVLTYIFGLSSISALRYILSLGFTPTTATLQLLSSLQHFSQNINDIIDFSGWTHSSLDSFKNLPHYPVLMECLQEMEGLYKKLANTSKSVDPFYDESTRYVCYPALHALYTISVSNNKTTNDVTKSTLDHIHSFFHTLSTDSIYSMDVHSNITRHHTTELRSPFVAMFLLLVSHIPQFHQLLSSDVLLQYAPFSTGNDTFSQIISVVTQSSPKYDLLYLLLTKTPTTPTIFHLISKKRLMKSIVTVIKKNISFIFSTAVSQTVTLHKLESLLEQHIPSDVYLTLKDIDLVTNLQNTVFIALTVDVLMKYKLMVRKRQQEDDQLISLLDPLSHPYVDNFSHIFEMLRECTYIPPSVVYFILKSIRFLYPQIYGQILHIFYNTIKIITPISNASHVINHNKIICLDNPNIQPIFFKILCDDPRYYNIILSIMTHIDLNPGSINLIAPYRTGFDTILTTPSDNQKGTLGIIQYFLMNLQHSTPPSPQFQSILKGLVYDVLGIPTSIHTQTVVDRLSSQHLNNVLFNADIYGQNFFHYAAGTLQPSPIITSLAVPFCTTNNLKTFCRLLLSTDVLHRTVLHQFTQASQLLFRFLHEELPSSYRGPIFAPNIYYKYWSVLSFKSHRELFMHYHIAYLISIDITTMSAAQHTYLAFLQHHESVAQNADQNDGIDDEANEASDESLLSSDEIQFIDDICLNPSEVIRTDEDIYPLITWLRLIRSCFYQQAIQP